MRNMFPRLPGEEPVSVRSIVDGLSVHEKKNYSLVKALLAADDPNYQGGGLEREVSQAIRQIKGITPELGGIWVPTSLPLVERSGLSTLSNAAGNYLVQGDVGTLIDLLRPKSLCLKLGAELLAGLSGNVLLPAAASGSTGAWQGENPGVDATDSDASLGQKSLSPKQYVASTSYSRKLLRQSSINIEQFVRNDVMLYVGTALDGAILNGSGSSNQPTGILNTSGVDVVAAGTNGAQIVYQNLLDMESHIGTANADVSLNFVTTPGQRSRMRGTYKISGQPSGLLWDGGKVLDYSAYATTQMPSTLTKGSSGAVCHACILGNFASVAIGEFGAIAISVDQFSRKKQAMLEVTVFAELDVCLRTPASFSVMKDLLA